ncbi:MAG: exonuclease domain-containing protein [Acidimicrobiaceae bacterium]|nr:exonuclease domain-containing protein [Acidimicrobiaceae bacterium]
MTGPIRRRRGRLRRNAVASAEDSPPATTFATIDFETATSSRDSACALGAVVVENGEIVEREGWLIRPPGNAYDGFNMNLHGIGPQVTERAPSFGEVWDLAIGLLEGKSLWAHSAAFDMSVLRHSAAGDSYELPSPVGYGCTYMIAKTTWPNRWSYSLDTLANDLGISLNHHDPVSDAEAAAHLLLLATEARGVPDPSSLIASCGHRPGIVHTDLSYDRYSTRPAPAGSGSRPRPADLGPLGDIASTGPLRDKKIVFTGTMSLVRRDAEAAAERAGAMVTDSVTRFTDYLVVGQTNLAVVGQDGLSGKARRAAELAANGSGIEIIDEATFRELLTTD